MLGLVSVSLFLLGISHFSLSRTLILLKSCSVACHLVFLRRGERVSFGGFVLDPYYTGTVLVLWFSEGDEMGEGRGAVLRKICLSSSSSLSDLSPPFFDIFRLSKGG